MFELDWGKLLVIGIVALVVIGPKDLPAALRTFGQWMAKLRRMAAEFQSQFQEAMREAEMADLKKQVDEMATEAKTYTNFDPVGDVRRELDSAQRQIQGALSEPPTPAPNSPAPGTTQRDLPRPGEAQATTSAPNSEEAVSSAQPAKVEAGDKA